jgi:hypothetical protein
MCQDGLANISAPIHINSAAHLNAVVIIDIDGEANKA